jgi:hypothetical protein
MDQTWPGDVSVNMSFLSEKYLGMQLYALRELGCGGTKSTWVRLGEDRHLESMNANAFYLPVKPFLVSYPKDISA